jgi:hypothetical protein
MLTRRTAAAAATMVLHQHCTLHCYNKSLVITAKASLEQEVGRHFLILVTGQVRLNAGVTLKAEALQPLNGCVIGLCQLNLQQQQRRMAKTSNGDK